MISAVVPSMYPSSTWATASSRCVPPAVTPSSAVTISIGPWVKVPDYGAAVGEINRAVLDALRDRGVSIPFPQREVRVVSEAVLRQGGDQRLAGRDAA